MGLADMDALYRSLASFCEMRYIQPTKMEIAPELIKKVPARFATHYGFVPVEERNDLVIAISDPLNTHLLDDIRLVLKQRIEATVATPTEIRKVTKELYGVGADTMERMLSESEQDGDVVDLAHDFQVRFWATRRWMRQSSSSSMN